METLLTRLLPQREPTAAVRYGATVLIVAVFVLLRHALAESLEGRVFLLFSLPVFLVSLLFGQKAGLLATGLCALAAGWFWITPFGGLRITNPDDLFSLALYLIIGTSIAALTEALRKAHGAAREMADRARHREREQTLLLRELNHRVRNDLQLVAALLRLSGSRATDPREALNLAAGRVAVLGRVYDRLGTQDAGRSVNARTFIEGLVDDLRAAVTLVRPVAFTVRAEPLEITTRCATMLGLAINELATNSLKYAFPDDRAGRIEVRFAHVGDGIALTVQDNGIGQTGTAASGTGLGTTLVRQLAAQHGGSVDIERADGYRTTIRLPGSSVFPEVSEVGGEADR